MSTPETSAAPAAARPVREKRPPDAHKGDVSVWIEPHPTKANARVASIAVGGKNEAKTYYKANATVNGVNLSAAEMLGLFVGDTLEVDYPAVGTKQAYTATLGRSGINTVPWKKNPEKFDLYMNIGMAFPLVKEEIKGGMKTGKREQWGWSTDRVTYPFPKHGDKQIPLGAADVFRLADKQTLQVGDVYLKLDRIEPDEKNPEYLRARIATSNTPFESEVVQECETVPITAPTP